MFKPSDLRGPMLAALVTAFAATAQAGVTPLATDAEKGKAGYQLRCWQEGRLLFEENQLALPSPAGAMRLVALDKSGRPIYLVDSPSTTCLLRHQGERPEPRPPQ